MASPSQNPLLRFFRGLFGFPEGEPGSCTCSGETTAAEIKTPEKGKAAEPEGRGNKDAREASTRSAAGCCG